VTVDLYHLEQTLHHMQQTIILHQEQMVSLLRSIVSYVSPFYSEQFFMNWVPICLKLVLQFLE